MNRTSIEWAQNPDGTLGWTWNPITGCLKGCEYCYARKLANGRLKERYLANDNIANLIVTGRMDDIEEEAMVKMADPFYPRFWPGKLEQIERPPAPSNMYIQNAAMDGMHALQNRHAKRKARGIFTCDMSDLFGIGIPKSWTRQILEAIRINSVDRFYLLTKQPQELVKWSPFPPNCWVGASVTNAQEQSDAYVGLGRIQATVKYLSYEPLLSNVVIEPQFLKDAGIDWLIIGAQTKPTVMPEVSRVREIVEAADLAGVKVFLKDSLRPLLSPDNLLCAEPFYRYTDLGKRDDQNPIAYRQEMPEVVPCAV